MLEKKNLNKQRNKPDNPQVWWLLRTMAWPETEIVPGWGGLLRSSPCAQAESGTTLTPKERSAHFLQAHRTAHCFPWRLNQQEKGGKRSSLQLKRVFNTIQVHRARQQLPVPRSLLTPSDIHLSQPKTLEGSKKTTAGIGSFLLSGVK